MEIGYFAQIPIDILFDKKLTSSQKLLYAAIHGLTMQKGYCWADNEFFAEQFEVDERTITRNISALKKKKLLFTLNDQGGKCQRRLYTITTYHQYLRDKKKRNLDKNVGVDLDKNVGVNINKNIKNKNNKTFSKEKDCTSRSAPKKKIKIKKKKDPVKDLARDYPLIVGQTYNELLELKCTKHGKETKAYKVTLDSLHKLLSKRAHNPFSKLQLHSLEERKKVYTSEELVQAFKFHLEDCEKRNIKPIKNIALFIFTYNFNGGDPYSPFLQTLQKMKQYDYNAAAGTVKMVMRETERINLKFNQNQVARLLSTLEKKTQKYSIPIGLQSTYGSIAGLFLNYLEERMRRKRLSTNIIVSERFIDNFVADSIRSGSLQKGNGVHFAF